MNSTARFKEATSKIIARALLILMLAVLVLAPSGAVIADDEADQNDSIKALEVIEQHPAEGSSNVPPTNVGVKLYFNGNFSDKDLVEQNKKCFKLVNAKGKEIPIEILFSDKEPNYVLVAAEPKNKNMTLGANKKYSLIISSNLEADDGATLKDGFELSFKTRDTSNDTTINMVLMGVMFVGMIGLMVFDSRRKAKKEAEDNKKKKVNPYKVAKEKGKSVEEVVESIEKKEARKAKRLDKKNKDEGDEDSGSDKGAGTYKVSAPSPISAFGGSYKPPKRAKKSQPQQTKNQSQGNKNKKKGKKKGKKKK